MSITFGDFIINRGLLSPEQLLLAFIHQNRNRTSDAETIFHRQLLPIQTQLAIFLNQSRNSLSYQSNAVALGCWSTDLEKKVEAIAQTKISPLTDAIFELELLSSEKMTQALKEYLEFLSQEKSDQTYVHAHESVEVERQDLDPFRELTSRFELHLGPKLQESITLLQDRATGRAAISSKIKMIFTELGAVNRIAEDLGAKMCHSQISKVIEYLAPLCDMKSGDEILTKIQVLTEILELAFHILDSMCSYLVEFKEEIQPSKDRNLSELQNLLQKKLTQTI